MDDNNLYQELESYIEYYFKHQSIVPFDKGVQKKHSLGSQENFFSQSVQEVRKDTCDKEKQRVTNFTNKQVTENPTSKLAVPIIKNEEQKLNPQYSESLDSLSFRIYGCQECNLCLNRKNIVFGQGNQKSKILLIGEGPGVEEDKEGIPFVGLAGQFLNKMLLGIAIARDAVYVTNIVKCRPPSNRNPQKKEMDVCSKILKKQIQILQPKMILLLGSVVFQWMFPGEGGIMKNHGMVFSYTQDSMKISTIATFHPAYLLRKPQDLSIAWQDFRKIRQLIVRLGIV